MGARPREIAKLVARNSKRIAVTVFGAVLVLAGVAMLVLPGPGIVVVALGFAVLGTEYAWAARALERTKSAAARAGKRGRNGASRATQGTSGTARSIGRRFTRH